LSLELSKCTMHFSARSADSERSLRFSDNGLSSDMLTGRQQICVNQKFISKVFAEIMLLKQLQATKHLLSKCTVQSKAV